jgi:hypothetical protein
VDTPAGETSRRVSNAGIYRIAEKLIDGIASPASRSVKMPLAMTPMTQRLYQAHNSGVIVAIP